MNSSTLKALALSAALLCAQPAWADYNNVFNDPCTGDVGCDGLWTPPGPALYHGGNGTSADGDIVGNNTDFDVLSMATALSGTNLVVTVLTRFVEFGPVNPDGSLVYPNTLYGDLMLTTTGWHPYGAAPYDYDTASNSGTSWNYVVKTEGADAGTVYHNAALAQATALTSDGDFRQDQYIGYGSGGTSTGSAGVAVNQTDTLPSPIDGSFDGSTGTELTYTIPLAALGLSLGNLGEIGLRWTMSCANDIVEAAIVPEPASLSLFLAGLAGLRLRRAQRAAAGPV